MTADPARSVRRVRAARRMIPGSLCACVAAALFATGSPVLQAQDTPVNSAAERRERAGFYLEPGWHPHLAIAPAIPIGRLGDLVSTGVAGHVGAWFLSGNDRLPGVGVELSYATLPKNTAEPLPGRYEMMGASLQLTSKGRQRLFFDWLGAYGTLGAGAVRHGASGSTTRTSPSASIGIGILANVLGQEGYFESRFQHVFSGETLGRGSGLTVAPLMFGVRF